MVQGFLNTVKELETDHSVLMAEMGDLRAHYMDALQTMDLGRVSLLGREIAAKTEQINALQGRITSYLRDAIPQHLAGGGA